MLVLTRKENQSILIQTPTGETIEIVIVGTKGPLVKVGINAPDDYLISRGELVE